MKKYDVLILGAGACGYFSAFNAKSNTNTVAILEKQRTPGKKILISGGGRCNVTNIYSSEKDYICQRPHFPKKVLRRFTPTDTVQFFNDRGVALSEKKLGQLFTTSNRSKDVLQCLERERNAKNIELHLNTEVLSIEKVDDTFLLKTANEVYAASVVVIASGGLAYPQAGGNDFFQKVAKYFELETISQRPALVPLLVQLPFNPSDLSGISATVILKKNKTVIHDDILFTHKGLSGPAILKISNYIDAEHGDYFFMNLLPSADMESFKTTVVQSDKSVMNYMSQYLPKKLVYALLSPIFNEKLEKPINTIAKKELNKLCETVFQLSVQVQGSTGYRQAEVMAGGISVSQVDSHSLQSKTVAGLYIGGEALDVTGLLGGYNLQWAWASGYCIGKDISQKHSDFNKT